MTYPEDMALEDAYQLAELDRLIDEAHERRKEAE